jgi:copper(I)-binding protein
MAISRVLLVLLCCACAAAAGAAEPPAIVDAWIRATPPGARTGAAYLTITSRGSADRLLGAATAAAGAVQLHGHVAEGGMARMVHLAELELPAGETVRLEPGGLHLMLLDLKAPLTAGATVAVTLHFAGAGAVELEVPVVDARAAPRGGARHQ